jgi:hypothetical protein
MYWNQYFFVKFCFGAMIPIMAFFENIESNYQKKEGFGLGLPY